MRACESHSFYLFVVCYKRHVIEVDWTGPNYKTKTWTHEKCLKTKSFRDGISSIPMWASAFVLKELAEIKFEYTTMAVAKNIQWKKVLRTLYSAHI